MIGTLIMAHADDDGAVSPPRIAPVQIVILPVTPKEETKAAVLAGAEKLAAELRKKKVWGGAIRVEVDKRDLNGGTKSWEWIKKGVPIRIEIGPRDLENGTVALCERHLGPKDKSFLPMAEVIQTMAKTLQRVQKTMLARALAFREAHTVKIDSLEEFRAYFTPANPDKPEIHGGFALAHWGGTAADEKRLQQEFKVTIRCIPKDPAISPEEEGTCFYTGRPSRKRLIFAKSY